ncbi:MAG: DeoR family transcriptional regulator, partial [Planctomycetota bacterium]
MLEAVNTGEFRADLYYRLERFTIALPPLRVRLDDLSALCSHFIAQATGGGQMRIGAELLARLRAHTWPGNVRELRNEIERLAILNPAATELGVDGSILPQTQTPAHVPAPASAPAADGPPADDPTLPGPPRARRRRTAIIQLLRHRGRLYRTEVIEHVGCAPATATADLRALIECGLIRRVETSGHLRT